MAKIWMLSLFFQIFVGAGAPATHYMDPPLLALASVRLVTRPALSHLMNFQVQGAPGDEAFHVRSTGGSPHALLTRSSSCAASTGWDYASATRRTRR